MYMPLEVPLGELAVAPINNIHEEVVSFEKRKRLTIATFLFLTTGGRICLPLFFQISPVTIQNFFPDHGRSFQSRRGAFVDGCVVVATMQMRMK